MTWDRVTFFRAACLLTITLKLEHLLRLVRSALLALLLALLGEGLINHESVEDKSPTRTEVVATTDIAVPLRVEEEACWCAEQSVGGGCPREGRLWSPFVESQEACSRGPRAACAEGRASELAYD